jgi:hypothetical protein
MLLDKLWVRIRGGLLDLKDDFSLGEDIRTKAEALLEKLDLRGEGEKPETHPETATDVSEERETQRGRTATLEEIRQEWEELLRSKEQEKGKTSEQQQPPPNPRRLG